MLYTGAVDALSAVALKKATAMKHSLGGFLILSVLAGFYVAFGVILAMVCAAPVAAINPGIGKIVAGATFGIALTLVIIAGCELLTGYNLLLGMGPFRGTVVWSDFILGSFWTFIGNLGGSMLFALMIIVTGIFAPDPWKSFILKVSAYKMNAPWWELFFRGIFCNWLVCLAIWCSIGRLTNESAKLIVIWWCLFCFVTTGMEHSVANMTIMTIANLLPHGPEISWGKMFGWNLVPVTLGNMVGGTFFVTFLYWFANYLDERGARKLESLKAVTGTSETVTVKTASGEEVKDVRVKLK